MAANQFEHESDAPSQPALEDHPFLTKVAEGEVSANEPRLDGTTNPSTTLQSTFIYHCFFSFFLAYKIFQLNPPFHTGIFR